MVDLTGQNHALEQVLQTYGEHTDSCGVHWKGSAASGGAVGEDSILAALDRVPVDEATGKLDPAASARTKSCLLIATINSGHARALRRLLEMGCSPNGAMDGYDTAAAVAELESVAAVLNEVHPEAIEKVLKRYVAAALDRSRDAGIADYAGPADPKNVTNLLKAAGGGTINGAISLVAAAMDPAVDSARPLNKAVKERNEPCVRVLLELGADPNAGRIKPLLVCAGLQQKSAEADAARVCRMLLDAGANADGVGHDQTTAVAHAARAGCDAVLATLVDHGANLELAVRGIFGSQSDTRYTPLEVAARGVTGELELAGTTEDTVRLLIRGGSKLEPQRAATGLLAALDGIAPYGDSYAADCATRAAESPEVVLRRGRRHALADLIRYVIANGGDAAEPNSTTPEALATRVALVDEFERLSAAFAVGDKVVVEGLKAKPKYNGKTAVVRGRVNARGRFPVTVEMRDGPETIALKLANLRAADE